MVTWVLGLAIGLAVSFVFELVFGGVFRAIGEAINTVIVTTGQYLFLGISGGYWQATESRNETVRLLCGFVGFFFWLALLIVCVTLTRET